MGEPTSFTQTEILPKLAVPFSQGLLKARDSLAQALRELFANNTTLAVYDLGGASWDKLGARGLRVVA